MSDGIAEAVTTAPPAPPPVPLEQRPIGEMPFEGGDATRALLRLCNVVVAEDIEKLGCTGAKALGLSIEQIAELRIGVGGGGVGLPCFVGIDRFCLAHNTIGGLQVDQAQLHPEQVPFISRELTPVEKGKVELIEAARRKQGKSLNERLVDTGDILSGREMAKGFEAVDGSSTESTLRSKGVPLGDEFPAVPPGRLADLVVETPWTCPEHKKTNWACRYCVAQAIVEGPLVPMYRLDWQTPHDGLPHNAQMPGESVDAAVRGANDSGAEDAVLYVRCATYTRRLAREE